MTPYWYFNQEGLVIFFNQYELTPRGAGVLKVNLSYDSLDGIVKKEYIPESAKGWVTGVLADWKRPDKETVYDVRLGEGEMLYITLRGKATHVQLSEVRFTEQTPVGSTMLFSANWLNEETTLALQANPDPEKIYAVEYYDASGGPRILYLQNNEIMTELKK